MTTPPHTCHAAATARLPAELRYWTDNLPPGHGNHTHNYLHFGGAQIHLDRYNWCLDRL